METRAWGSQMETRVSQLKGEGVPRQGLPAPSLGALDLGHTEARPGWGCRPAAGPQRLLPRDPHIPCPPGLTPERSPPRTVTALLMP